MRIKWLLIMGIHFILPLLSQASQVVGKAYEKDKLVYTEDRKITSNRNYVAHYSGQNGKVFAKKEVSYPNSHPWAPLFTLEDYRHDYKLQVKAGGEGVEVYLKKEGEVKTGSFPVSKNSIWDAGIHYFIVDNWDKLENTQTREVFIVELMKSFKFDFTRTGNQVEMKIHNTILSWLVDPIYVIYDNERKMKQYDGVSDISDEEAEQLDVKIYYSYPR